MSCSATSQFKFEVQIRHWNRGEESWVMERLMRTLEPLDISRILKNFLEYLENSRKGPKCEYCRGFFYLHFNPLGCSINRGAFICKASLNLSAIFQTIQQALFQSSLNLSLHSLSDLASKGLLELKRSWVCCKVRYPWQ